MYTNAPLTKFAVGTLVALHYSHAPVGVVVARRGTGRYSVRFEDGTTKDYLFHSLYLARRVPLGLVPR